MVYLTISTGVGGGIVIDGRLYRGASGNGGELGHVTVDCARPAVPRLRPPRLPRGLRLRDLDRRARAARRGHGRRALAADVAAAARAGDPVARAVWDETVDALACGLTSIVNLFEPELVVLGGGVVSGTGEQLLGPVRDARAGRVRCRRRPRACRSCRRRSASTSASSARRRSRTSGSRSGELRTRG